MLIGTVKHNHPGFKLAVTVAPCPVEPDASHVMRGNLEDADTCQVTRCRM